MEISKELQQFNLADRTAKVKILTGQVAENIIEIGRTLLEVKENLSYGEFQNWLENDVNYSKSTAYNFMKISKAFPDFQSVGNLGMRKLLALTGLEMDNREKVVADNDLESMTVKQVEKTIKEEKMVKEVEKFMEKLSQKLPVEESSFNYTEYGFTDEEIQELEQIRHNLNEVFENNRIQQYETLLVFRKIFADEKRFAKFVIQTGLKEAIEELVFERGFPDKLCEVWDRIEYNLNKFSS